MVELLNRYLKPYVKKLDTSQLKVAVWKGEGRARIKVYKLTLVFVPPTNFGCTFPQSVAM